MMTNKEKQIEKLGFIIQENSPLSEMSSQDLAEAILEDGYHKQSEWISVDEALPEKNGKYLCFCRYHTGRHEGYIQINGFALDLSTVDEYDFEGVNRAGWHSYDLEYGYFEQTNITHWMPLPEAPKVKGGAE